ncbi:MAG: UDP-N-acetylmuramoyl-tripeptide--D-alanyl-D-alanine ligase, partial [Phycisphaerae bacterium]|nr:UDP-N-acetylmuramoyl-tripeptide--D-alanyl-D-alanine ligase [Phycisphaerae bacterium]
MKQMRVDEVRTAVAGRWLKLGLEVSVDAVTTDTRTARPGSIFVALKGERFDGHGFLKHAAKAGCLAAIVRMDAEPPPQVARLFPGGLIGVGETADALGRLAAYHRGITPAMVVAVTGSNGKTTVKRMIHHILRRHMKGSCSPKSFNNEIGVPLTLLSVDSGDDYVVCEVGSSSPGEIAALGRIVRPKVAVITSIAPTHLERLGDLQRVAVEKASLLGALTADGLAVVSADSAELDRALRAYDSREIRFGLSETAALRVTDYRPNRTGQRFELNGRAWFDLRVAGRHNAVNALAAIAVAQRFGIDQDAAAAALADFDGVDMRLEWAD